MDKLKKLFKPLLLDKAGATAIEYGLILGTIALVLVLAFTTLGTGVKCAFMQGARAACDGGGGSGSSG